MTNYRPLPPTEELKELFAINEEVGLIWKKKPHPKAHVEPGDVAGCASPEGYRRVTVQGRHYYAHRIVWAIVHGNDPSGLQIDHINRDTTDNRPSNLRLATGRQNALNRDEGCSSATGEQCIYLTGRKKNPYKAVAYGKHLGNFKTIEEAKKARDMHRENILSQVLGTVDCKFQEAGASRGDIVA
jgi:hypothetical protein